MSKTTALASLKQKLFSSRLSKPMCHKNYNSFCFLFTKAIYTHFKLNIRPKQNEMLVGQSERLTHLIDWTVQRHDIII